MKTKQIKSGQRIAPAGFSPPQPPFARQRRGRGVRSARLCLSHRPGSRTAAGAYSRGLLKTTPATLLPFPTEPRGRRGDRAGACAAPRRTLMRAGRLVTRILSARWRNDSFAIGLANVPRRSRRWPARLNSRPISSRFFKTCSTKQKSRSSGRPHSSPGFPPVFPRDFS